MYAGSACGAFVFGGAATPPAHCCASVAVSASVAVALVEAPVVVAFGAVDDLALHRK